MEEMTLAIVGIDYPNENGSNQRFELLTRAPGDAMRLVHEPTNATRLQWRSIRLAIIRSANFPPSAAAGLAAASAAARHTA